MMLHAGLDLSRRRLEYCLLDEQGERVEVGAAPPDADGLAGLARRVGASYGSVPVRAAIESMNGARFVHDALEREGWQVEVADAQKVRGLAPLACKTDRIDAWVLAELSRRDLVPAIWLPEFAQRAERERARWRLYLVRKRSSLEHRVHAQLLAFGHPRPLSDLFGRRGRELLARLDFSRAVARRRGGRGGDDRRPGPPDRRHRRRAASPGRRPPRRAAAHERARHRLGAGLHHRRRDRRHRPLLISGHLAGYTGLCPRVYQSGDTDRRGPLTHAGPTYLRWALMEAATHACRHPAYRARYLRTKRRLGRQRGPKVAQVDVARRLAEAIWWMLTRDQPFAPAGATSALAA